MPCGHGSAPGSTTPRPGQSREAPAPGWPGGHRAAPQVATAGRRLRGAGPPTAGAVAYAIAGSCQGPDVRGTDVVRRGRQRDAPGRAGDAFLVSGADTVESVRAGHRAARTSSRQVATGPALDDAMAGHRLGPVTLRWIRLHSLREYARHGGGRVHELIAVSISRQPVTGTEPPGPRPARGRRRRPVPPPRRPARPRRPTCTG